MDFSFFTVNNKSGYKTKEIWVKKNEPDLYKSIINYSLQFNFELSFKEKILFYFNLKVERPKCITCGNDVKFRERFDKPYGEFCSLICINTNKDEMLKRQKKTFNQKYSVDFYPEYKEFMEKQKSTKKIKYGDENYNNVEKSKKTKKLKYGNQNYNNIEKQKQTIQIKYGSDNISKSLWYKKQTLKTFKTKYLDLDIKSIEGETVKIKCPKCNNDYNITKQLIYERHKRNYIVCIGCNPIGQSSQSGHELKINEYLTSLNVETVQSYRKLPKKLEIDIFIPSKNLGIEINGVYWHNELFKNNDYHLIKHKLCEDNGITLIQFFEDELLFKDEIVKSIIKNRLGLISNKIYSRKCDIKEVTSKESKLFLEENHIQGNVNSKIKLGLFLNNELVSLMTFSNGRIIMGGNKNQWELTRFCNKKDTSVVGAASKLFKHFLKQYKPSNVISYSDVRLFDGGMYEKLGFEKKTHSKPNYWYVINNLRYYRFNFRKSILIKNGYDKNKTEKEIMFERGIYRIYDCGNIRWEFKL
jgi:hypothetical protein